MPAMQRIGFDRIDDFLGVKTPDDQRADAQRESAKYRYEKHALRIHAKPGAEAVTVGQIEAYAMEEIDTAPEAGDNGPDNGTGDSASQYLGRLTRPQVSLQRAENLAPSAPVSRGAAGPEDRPPGNIHFRHDCRLITRSMDRQSRRRMA